MGKRIFLCTGQRSWRFITKFKERHEFDVRYKNSITNRLKKKKENDYDYVLLNPDCNLISNYLLIRKISETSGLPESIVNCVLLDFLDLVSLALINEKQVLVHSFGTFKCKNGDVEFLPAKQLRNECQHIVEKDLTSINN